MPSDSARRLLDWYDRHRRDLPWRAPPGVRPDPYHVWLSEIMLQQTTVAAVKGYFLRFLERWPTVEALAGADASEVLAAWAGLGYYARARNLHACAGVVAQEHAGRFPQTEAGLKALPGIGDYTAAAIAAIAFGRSAVAVDGNVERVIARLYRICAPLPAAKAEIKRRAAATVPAERPGDYTQALMDLGATVCTPRRPNCLICPWRSGCAAHAAGEAERYPVKAPKKAKPTRRAMVFWLTHGGEVLLRRRPPQGLLGGMLELPSSPWEEQPLPAIDAVAAHAPADAVWRVLPGIVRHSFTHFDLELGLAAACAEEPAADGLWTPVAALAGLPTVMKKAAVHALSATAQGPSAISISRA